MLDPLTALGLVSNIAQLVDFGMTLVSDAREISELGSTSEHEHIRTIVNDMGKLSAIITKKNGTTSSASANKEEVDLHKLGQSSCNVANELAALLDGLEIQGQPRKRKRDLVRQSIKTAFEKEDVQRLQRRLDRLQQLISLRVTIMMSQQVHCDVVRKEILRTLVYHEIQARQDDIPGSYRQTFQWIFDDSSTGFPAWAQTGSGIFWVSGKAGSGKSTLMKYLSSNSKTSQLIRSWAGTHELVIAQHYFWIAGTTMQNSQTGLLRSLLFQILDECPELAPIVTPSRFYEQDTSVAPWTLSELDDTIRKIAHQKQVSKRFCFFVDGLAEYDGDHREILDLLFDLCKSLSVKLCLSSRPWNVFVLTLGKLGPSNKIQVHELTVEDIRIYVKGSLRDDQYFLDLWDHDQSGASALIEDIVTKAQCVFLWVFLVVRSLRRGLTEGDNLCILQERLYEFPDDLDGYFRRMFDTTDRIYKKEAAKILLVAWHADGKLDLRALDFLRCEAKRPDYDVVL